jgi:hypothetical protein
MSPTVTACRFRAAPAPAHAAQTASGRMTRPTPRHLGGELPVSQGAGPAVGGFHQIACRTNGKWVEPYGIVRPRGPSGPTSPR